MTCISRPLVLLSACCGLWRFHSKRGLGRGCFSVGRSVEGNVTSLFV